MATSQSSSELRKQTTRRRGSRRRSRSPADRRGVSRKSRSRSSEKRAHKKHVKKEKKRHEKQREEKQEAENTTPFHSVEVKEGGDGEGLPMKTAPVDAKSFFEQLQKREAAKEPVGTVHSRGFPAPVSATTISTSDKWECSKAGCGHMNFKHAPACNKCGAMKRMTEWR